MLWYCQAAVVRLKMLAADDPRSVSDCPAKIIVDGKQSAIAHAYAVLRRCVDLRTSFHRQALLVSQSGRT